MAKRSRKAPLTDPRLGGLEAVEEETADEAEILRNIGESDKDAAAAKARKAAGRKRKRKRT